MTSTVTGELRPEVGFQQIFRALFPCGSITGAPKVRAMQLIAQLEDQPRGVYTGAIGFFSPEQTVFNVAIRTLELEGQSGELDASTAHGRRQRHRHRLRSAAEFRECLLKAEFLTRASNPPTRTFSLIETLLWHGGYPLIELHLDRLEDSADYFGFPCDRAELRKQHSWPTPQSLAKAECAGCPIHSAFFLREWVGSQESQSAEPPRKVRSSRQPRR